MLVPELWRRHRSFSPWLKERMERRRVNQRELARLTGLDHSTISRLLSAQREPGLWTALALLEALDGD